MVVATLLWSMAGVVTRHLESAGGFEATFWRSVFNAAALVVLLARLRGVAALKKTLLSADPTLWLSGLCWAVMFTAFMVAITMTTVANVLVTMAIAPLLTALVARVVLGQRLPLRTWAAIVVAGVGIGWMYAHELAVVDARHLAGTAVALAVPIAAALNWTAIQRSRGGGADLLAAVLIGALLSSLLTLPLAAPLSRERARRRLARAARRRPARDPVPDRGRGGARPCRARSGAAVAARDRLRRDVDLARRQRSAEPPCPRGRRAGAGRAGC